VDRLRKALDDKKGLVRKQAHLALEKLSGIKKEPAGEKPIGAKKAPAGKVPKPDKAAPQ